MMATLDASISEISEGRVTLTSSIPTTCRQQQGFAHAALTFGIGDSAAGYAALSLMPRDADVLTTEMKINLLAPGTGDRLVATGRVIKPGRRLMIVQADVWAEENDKRLHVALLTGTMMPVFPKG
ncbi:PaaI family thioesterase [Shimia biformata]|uniref:PaaI family thioesterase n=1 Tax=Shimia biformata TaxID=1294299 RepID=UPI001EF274C3|nr:PaaI family thioesterase [Shimia biformata]